MGAKKTPFGNEAEKIAYVQREGVILTLKPNSPINKRQIIVYSITLIGDGISINCAFKNSFLMNSVLALIDVVDWEWMEENTCLKEWSKSY
jgi:hypothetical protein